MDDNTLGSPVDTPRVRQGPLGLVLRYGERKSRMGTRPTRAREAEEEALLAIRWGVSDTSLAAHPPTMGDERHTKIRNRLATKGGPNVFAQ